MFTVLTQIQNVNETNMLATLMYPQDFAEMQGNYALNGLLELTLYKEKSDKTVNSPEYIGLKNKYNKFQF